MKPHSVSASSAEQGPTLQGAMEPASLGDSSGEATVKAAVSRLLAEALVRAYRGDQQAAREAEHGYESRRRRPIAGERSPGDTLWGHGMTYGLMGASMTQRLNQQAPSRHQRAVDASGHQVVGRESDRTVEALESVTGCVSMPRLRTDLHAQPSEPAPLPCRMSRSGVQCACGHPASSSPR